MKLNKKIINLINLKILIWKKKNNYNYKIRILSDKKKFNIIYKNIFIDKWNNSIEFNKKIISQNNIKIRNFFNFFLKFWDMYFYEKIKFKGKGFRIKFFKKIKLIKFYFGRSHRTFFFFQKIKIKKINKYKFIILSKNKKEILKTSKNILKIKKINFYTLRGLRLSRQIIKKRKGKKGAYI